VADLFLVQFQLMVFPFQKTVLSGEKPVREPACGQRGQKENDGHPQGLGRDQREHDERLVPAGGDHGGHQGAEAHRPVGVEGYDGKGAEAPWYRTQRRAKNKLPRPALAQQLLPGAAGLHVEILDQQHHDEHETSDHQRVFESGDH